ncbi:hypothetical protein CBG46_09550 [Actinobacillus succinogenes]|nr:hypothetical protein CBG46_09550 [Actinobacillus succinogenes]
MFGNGETDDIAVIKDESLYYTHNRHVYKLPLNSSQILNIFQDDPGKREPHYENRNIAYFS